MGRHLEIGGQRFGILTAVKRLGAVGRNQSVWECRCDCGVTKTVRLADLRMGKTKSCGCAIASSVAKAKLRHGHGGGRDRAPSSEYRCWASMIQRCENANNPSFRDYGGRGIKVCNRWKRFDNFLEDMGNKPLPGYTLERIDFDGPYAPENCKWIPRSDQSRNRRSCVLIECRGKILSVAEWSREGGVRKDVIRCRLNSGWDAERAIFEPITRGDDGLKVYRANMAVCNAIRRGKLPRANAVLCCGCGAQAKQYHHHKGHDRQHWLDVVPLCMRCHGMTRRKYNFAKRASEIRASVFSH